MEFNTIKQTSNWGTASSLINDNFQKTSSEIESLKASLKYFKGYFISLSSLKFTFPSPRIGDYAYVGSTYPGVVYVCNIAGTWHSTGVVPSIPPTDLNDYSKKEDTEALREQLSNNSDILNRFTSIINTVSESGVHFADSTGYDVMNYTEKGFDVAKASEHFISLILSGGVITEDMLSEEVKSMIGTLNLGETSDTAYAGDKGKSNADSIVKLEASLKSLAKLLEVVSFMQKVKESGFHVADSTGKDVMNYTESGLDIAKASGHLISLILSSGVITKTMLSEEVKNFISESSENTGYLSSIIMKVLESGYHFPDSTGKDVMNYTEAGFDVAKVSEHFISMLKRQGIGSDYIFYSTTNINF